MAKQETAKERAIRFASRFQNNYLVIRSLIALFFFVIAFGLFYSLAVIEGDLIKTLVAIYGVLVLLLCHGVILEYAIKTIALQNNENVNRFTAILAINTALGLAMPIWLMNLVLNSVIQLMDMMTYYGTYLCEVRVGIIRYYYANDVYYMLQKLSWQLLTASILIFVLGGIIERYFIRK
jgi:hypothetical protein